jgi:flavin reductase (DIM6/NTAB) family NADH-FMN oxidoreductase RutF
VIGAAESLRFGHRLLGPRVVYLVGTRSADQEPNLIPVTNITSISISPQLIVVAVSKKWGTCENLQFSEGFTLSVPAVQHRGGVWRLGPRYSGYPITRSAEKLEASGLAVTDDPSLPGPILLDGHGWMACRVVARPDAGGDHGVFIGEVTQVQVNPHYLNFDCTPVDSLHPLMQITGNRFTTSTPELALPYGPDR